MPKLIRLYIINVAIGFALAAVFVAMLLWFNIGNLWHLVTHSDKGVACGSNPVGSKRDRLCRCAVCHRGDADEGR